MLFLDPGLVHADLFSVEVPARQEHFTSRHQATEHFPDEDWLGTPLFLIKFAFLYPLRSNSVISAFPKSWRIPRI